MSNGARTWVVVALVVLGCLGIVGGAVALVRVHPPVDEPTIDRRDGEQRDAAPPEGEVETTMPVYQVGSTPDGPFLYREEVSTSARGDDMLAEAARVVLDGDSADPRRGLSVAYDDVSVEVVAGMPMVRIDGDVDQDPSHRAGTELVAQALVYTITAVRKIDAGVAFDVDGGTLLGVDVSQPLTRDDRLQAPVQITSPTYGEQLAPGPLVEGQVLLGPDQVSWRVFGPGARAQGTSDVSAGGRFAFPAVGETGEYDVIVSVEYQGSTYSDQQYFTVR